MADINSAPAAIAAHRELYERLEPLADALMGLAADAAVLADSMGDFAIGGEQNTAQVAEIICAEAVSAKEGMAAYIARLETEYEPSIEAAAGKTASVHSAMQEA